MAELLLRSALRLPPLPGDPVAAAAMFRAGDIVSWGPDGFGWSFEERNSGLFVIIASTDMALGEAVSLCDPLPPDLTAATVPSAASHRFDLTNLPAVQMDGKYYLASASVLAAVTTNPYFPVA